MLPLLLAAALLTLNGWALARGTIPLRKVAVTAAVNLLVRLRFWRLDHPKHSTPLRQLVVRLWIVIVAGYVLTRRWWWHPYHRVSREPDPLAPRTFKERHPQGYVPRVSRFNRCHGLPADWAVHPRPLADKPDQVRSILDQFKGAQSVKLVRKPKHRPTHRKLHAPKPPTVRVLWRHRGLRGVPMHMANPHLLRRMTWKRRIASAVAFVLLLIPAGAAIASMRVADSPITKVAFVAPPVAPAGIPADEWHAPVGTVQTEVGSWAKRNTTGNDDRTVGIDLFTASTYGFVVFWWGGAGAASGTPDNNIAAGIGLAGVSNGTITQFSTGGTSDNGGAANAARGISSTNVLHLPTTTGGTTQWEAVLSFTSTTNMRLAFGTNAGGTERINYFLVGGLTAAKVTINDTPAGATGTVTESGLTFSPDLVFHVATLLTAGAQNEGFACNLNIGVVNKHGQQWANSAAIADTAGTSNTSSWQQTDACMALVSEGEDNRYQAHFQTMESNGWKVYFSENDAGARKFFSLAVAGLSSKIGSFIKSTTSGATTQDIMWAKNASQGGTIRGLMFSSVCNLPLSAPTSWAQWSMGASDLTTNRAVGILDKDNVGTTISKSEWRSDAAIMLDQNGATGASTSYASVSATTTTTFTLNYPANTTQALEGLYLVIFDSGTNTWPNFNLDTATTNIYSSAFSNQKHVAVLSSGRQVRVVGETTTNARLEWSDTGLAGSWTDYGADVGGWSNGSITVYTDSGGTQRLVVVWEQSGTSGTGPTGGARTSGYTYIAVGTLNAGATTVTWGAAFNIGALGSALYGFPDLVVYPYTTGARVAIVQSYVSGSSNNVNFETGSIDASGVYADVSNINYGGSYGVAIDTYPSIAINPTDGRIFSAWSAGTTGSGNGVRFRTGSFSAGTWTHAAEVEVDNTRYINGSQSAVICQYYTAGAMVVLGCPNIFDGANDDIMQYESTNFTAFTTRTLVNNATAANRLYYGGFTIDQSTGDSYFYGQNTAGDNLGYYQWVRLTTTLGSRAVSDGCAAGFGWVYAWYQTSDQSVRWTYTRGNNAPYAIAEDMLPVPSGNTHQLINAA